MPNITKTHELDLMKYLLELFKLEERLGRFIADEACASYPEADKRWLYLFLDMINDTDISDLDWERYKGVPDYIIPYINDSKKSKVQACHSTPLFRWRRWRINRVIRRRIDSREFISRLCLLDSLVAYIDISARIDSWVASYVEFHESDLYRFSRLERKILETLGDSSRSASFVDSKAEYCQKSRNIIEQLEAMRFELYSLGRKLILEQFPSATYRGNTLQDIILYPEYYARLFKKILDYRRNSLPFFTASSDGFHYSIFQTIWQGIGGSHSSDLFEKYKQSSLSRQTHENNLKSHLEQLNAQETSSPPRPEA